MTPAPQDSPFAGSGATVLRNVLLYLGVWVVVLTALIANNRYGITQNWSLSTVRVIREWFPWVILGPLLWWVVKRFPLYGRNRSRHLAIHLIVSLVTAIMAETLIALVIHPATQPIVERIDPADIERTARRGAKGGKARRTPPPLRQEEYRFRPRTLVRKVPIWFLLNWCFVLIGTAILQRRAVEERERRALELKNDLAEARLREMQNRLQPHFLFNALNSISALILVDPAKADEMVTRLANLLRRVLVAGEQNLIPLREELDLLRDYLAIEQVRFSDRLSVEESVDDSAMPCLIPPLILQPLAENAVKHGIEAKSSPSTIRILAGIEGPDQLVIRIIDDGIGSEMSGGEPGLGIGMDSVRGRLETVFPGDSSLLLEYPAEGGTSVTVQLPRIIQSAN